MKGERGDGPPGGIHVGGGGFGGRHQRGRRGWRWNGGGRGLRGDQAVEQLLLGIEHLLLSIQRLPLLVELFLLGRDLFAQLGDVVGLGGRLGQTQGGEQHCER